MKQIVYSDTEYFYNNLQKMLRNFSRIKIISDYEKISDVPITFLYFLRLNDKIPSFCKRKRIGDAVIPGHLIEINADRFNRLIFIIHSMYDKI